LETVVVEERGDGVPNVGIGVRGLHDDVDNILGDGGVEPQHDALIVCVQGTSTFMVLSSREPSTW
jgi:hypothetical protein